MNGGTDVRNLFRQLTPGYRLLMGPGPSEVNPRVLRAMSTELLGHLDPEFLEIMNQTMDLLRYVFQTENKLTIPMSGTGSAGMETIMANLLEPGDKAIICINGVFGQRMRDVAARCGAEVISVKAPWGDVIQPEQVSGTLKKVGKVKLIGIVHAETSTGVIQPLKEISRIAKQHDCLFVVDAVTSLGGIQLKVDEWGIDACYSGTQKALSCPPGLAPVTLSEKAIEVLNKRKNKVQSWYLDLTMIQNYWGKERFYHHTAPINMIYGLREALMIINEEGLEQRIARHELNSNALVAGLEAMGLEMVVKEKQHRLTTLTAVRAPKNVDDVKVRKYLLEKYGIEIGDGLGEFEGRVWRIGLMGEGSRQRNVLLLLVALGDALAAQGYKVDYNEALQAALSLYKERE
jgi:alanine-glyoxylate transaminase/serine-glyoxylate transaminase/serine-pyruvate transaminase